MNRKEMVKTRTEELTKLSDMQLVDSIVKYFEQNATMPGEKTIKDYALSLKGEFDGNAINGLLSQVRNDLIEEFASLCVKEVKLKNVTAANETKKNEGSATLRASDLPMVLTDTKPIPVNTMKNVFTLPASICEGNTGNTVCFMNADNKLQTFAALPAGFGKNHPTTADMDCIVIATDYSNGKFANMSYSMLIDLGQRLAA